jgi:urease accessory protein
MRTGADEGAGPELALLLLADGRFPAGGHVHSAGVESAVADGRVHDLASLEAYVRGRLASVAVTDAALAAATTLALVAGDRPVTEVLGGLDAEAAARIPVPVLRTASRRQGRQLVRVAGRCWPSPALAAAPGVHPDGVHLAVALGAVGAAAGLTGADVARLSVHHAVATPAQAAVRLLGLDPFAVAALTARMAGPAAAVAAEAVAAAAGPPGELPARTGPLLDVAADDHPRWDMRLFAT